MCVCTIRTTGEELHELRDSLSVFEGEFACLLLLVSCEHMRYTPIQLKNSRFHISVKVIGNSTLLLLHSNCHFFLCCSFCYRLNQSERKRDRDSMRVREKFSQSFQTYWYLCFVNTLSVSCFLILSSFSHHLFISHLLSFSLAMYDYSSIWGNYYVDSRRVHTHSTFT